MTTYQHCYSPSSPRGPTRYLQFPSIVHRGSLQQPPRQFPVQPVGPKRNLKLDPEGPVLGLGSRNINTQRFLEPKEIIASPNPSLITCSLTKPARERKSARRVRPQGTDRPQSHQVHKTKFGSMDSDLIDCLARRIQWKSTSSAAAQEACLKFPRIDPPSSTLETTPDIVRLVGQRYESRPMEWQRAVLWDFIQSRGTVHHEDLKERTYSQPEKLYLKSVRQCPGYSGFVPRTPTESDLAQRPQPTYMMSTMKANYRELPDEVYRKQTHARKGPLSRMVTLTYPFNPYNKV
ncbi:uncharacterized protein LOC111137733 isoform X2 [Crassostrea virginica]